MTQEHSNTASEDGLEERTRQAQKILVVDQETPFGKLIISELVQRKLEVISTQNERLIYDLVLNERPDLLIVNFDKFLKEDGHRSEKIQRTVEQSNRVRLRDQQIWLLAINTSASLSEKINLLKEGFDEVFPKPVSTDELFIKTEKMLSRSVSSNQKGILKYAHLKIDLLNRRVWSRSKEVSLRSKEFDLLKVFMLSPEKTLSKKQIFDQVWGSNFIGDSNVIEVYIKYLRTKIGCRRPINSIIRTERGRGYSLVSEEAIIKRSRKEITLE